MMFEKDIEESHVFLLQSFLEYNSLKYNKIQIKTDISLKNGISQYSIVFFQNKNPIFTLKESSKGEKRFFGNNSEELFCLKYAADTLNKLKFKNKFEDVLLYSDSIYAVGKVASLYHGIFKINWIPRGKNYIADNLAKSDYEDGIIFHKPDFLKHFRTKSLEKYFFRLNIYELYLKKPN